jgi:integrase
LFNRALPVLAALLKYAEALRLRRKGSNPCRGMPRYWREPKERYLTPAEYRRIGAALREQEVAYPAQVALMRLLLFIGRGCGSACKRDPVSGVIGVQKGTTIPIV